MNGYPCSNSWGETDHEISRSSVADETPHTAIDLDCMEKMDEKDTAAELLESTVIEVRLGVKCKEEEEEESGDSKACRICHLSPEIESGEHVELMQLGCCCRGQLSTVHPQCGEAWFKLKGDLCCEICGKIAKNISGVADVKFMEEWSEGGMLSSSSTSSSRRYCWRDQPVCNLLIVCLVIAFILPWFFRADIL